MTVYRDPHAPSGRVVLSSIPFVDGLTADIDPGPGTLQLFAACGISEVLPEPSTPDTATAQVETEPSKPRKRK